MANTKKVEENGYFDRVKHYFCLSNPIHLVLDEDRIKEAEEITAGKSKKKNLTDADKKAAKCTFEATHDPRTGQRLPMIRMLAAQAPTYMVTIGGMLAYYQTVPQIVFWQWLHQSLVSYKEYKKNDPLVSNSQIALSYTYGTIGAVATALSLHKYMKCSSPLKKRFIPLVAVAVGSTVNSALTNIKPITEGIPVFTAKGAPVGTSKIAGSKASLAAVARKINDVDKALILTPLFLNCMENKNKFCKAPWLEAVCAFTLTGLLLYVSTPFFLASSFYSDKKSIPTIALEPDIQKKAKNDKELFYYSRT